MQSWKSHRNEEGCAEDGNEAMNLGLYNFCAYRTARYRPAGSRLTIPAVDASHQGARCVMLSVISTPVLFTKRVPIRAFAASQPAWLQSLLFGFPGRKAAEPEPDRLRRICAADPLIRSRISGNRQACADRPAVSKTLRWPSRFPRRPRWPYSRPGVPTKAPR